MRFFAENISYALADPIESPMGAVRCSISQRGKYVEKLSIASSALSPKYLIKTDIRGLSKQFCHSPDLQHYIPA